MLSRRALHALIPSLAWELCAPRVASAAPSRELFTLARSKNANVVKYSVRTGREGRLDLARPVEAYWLMLAEDGRREELTWAERQLAYGFSVSALSSSGLILHLAACASRAMRVRSIEGGYRAELQVAGQPAFLRRIFVRTDEGLLMPHVRYVEISGLTGAGQPVLERIVRS